MRVLIFSADIGEGHDLPARVLRDGILAREPMAEVTILDALAVAGRAARAITRGHAEIILRRAPWVFDAQYWLLTHFPPTRALGRRLASALGSRGLMRALATYRPDIVVSTYPAATEVLGALRCRGDLRAPLASAITDLAALRYWAHPGCDLHLVIHPESAAEVRAVAGADTRIECVRGLTAPEFESPVDQDAARAGLGLARGVPLVVVSGGGWGVGDLQGAVAAVLDAGPDVHALAVCGRNARAQAALEARFVREPRVTVMGFTDRMSDVLASADVLVHSTAGLTVLEALVRGARVISYGWGVAHVRVNNRAYVRFGLADVVTQAPALRPAVARALASPRRPDLRYGERPAAADRVLALVGGASGLLDPPHGPRRTQDPTPG